ncbi:MAG: glucose-6-phosphate isomerase [Proteobacteria bacterium]|nr:glucose-6-phosphate isomerase [Pseudomonadota bacterium]
MFQRIWQGISPSLDLVNKVEDYLKSLQNLPYLQILTQKDDLLALESYKDYFSSFETVLILGTGGSSLGGKTLYQALGKRSLKKLIFYDNVDPYSFHALLSSLDLVKTAVLAISKSGNTAETLMQLLLCMQTYQEHSLSLKDHFFLTCEQDQNAFYEIAKKHHLITFPHPKDIGGRFAVFTLVGLLPALLMGLKGELLRYGAKEYYEQYKRQISEDISILYALAHQHYTQCVMMPYSDRLQSFCLWYRQLWAESLGKEGKGLTPIEALGTVDQHSQLQLYLDGPRDKIFTLIYVKDSPSTNKILDTYSHPFLQPLLHKTMNDLFFAEYQATLQTLVEKGCPSRSIILPQLDELTLGALLNHFIMETLGMAHLLNINPFDQPAVEKSKRLTYSFLQTSV